MIAIAIRGLGSVLVTAAFAMPITAHAQGVPTVDLTSIAKIGEVLAEAKLQVKELIASNLKLDEQILKQIEQITTLKAQLDALRNGLTLEALGIPDPDTFFDDILPDIFDLTGGLIAAKGGNYSLMTSSGKVGGKPATQYVSEFFASAGIDRATVDTLAKSEDAGAARIGAQANTAAFLSAAAESSSVKATESLERVHELVQEIPDTEGLKEAIDLNTRMTAELSIALANIWNMESAQLMGMGEAGVMDAATAADEQKFIKVLGGQ
ncbi:type IV secretion system protein [Gemmobacter fulvus]|uniref:type IV secretion system protein n=1 Tax=Gemmobacter fulvus TaxID=2840474 RepID=UPI002796487B|nr:type IV secretion system protein [Gemmobacter fulvus]MDQ1850589.1 type IV secretion system protein [Gemmobacter fulvus]